VEDFKYQITPLGAPYIVFSSVCLSSLHFVARCVCHALWHQAANVLEQLSTEFFKGLISPFLCDRPLLGLQLACANQ
jgi:hypothetical protein